MRFARPTLALASLAAALALPGCFGSHGAGPDRDAGPPPPDAPGCRTLPGSAESLVCRVDAAGVASVELTTTPFLCCSSGTVTWAARRAGSRVDVELSWTACDCCETCRCVNPIETVRVELGSFEPGTYEVRAGAASCSFTVPPAGSCRPATADETRMATVLFDDQPFAATLVARGGASCSCSPRVAAFDPAAPEVRLELCECCDECECIDPGYVAGTLGPPLPVGRHEIVVPHGVASLEVTTRDRCRPLEPTGLEIIPPDAMLLQGGDRITWARVGGTERLCCVPPAPAVDQGTGPGGEFALTLHSCVQEDCACVGSEVPFATWHALGVLRPGSYAARAGAFTTSFVVP